ncbi:MAG: ABC transporter permease [Bacteroidetes bacterium B1(2017)]|nr:MAG: ABC transporter permease [Bacteroidetes bacterium B1(2017)]
MRTIRLLLEKEFRQIFRNKSILALILVMPTMQLIILPLAANYEVKNINLAVVDNDHSSYSQQMVQKIVASGYFRMSATPKTFEEGMRLIELDKADLILEIPSGFERNLVKQGSEKVYLAVNAINGVKAGLGGTYLSSILRNYNQEILLNWVQGPKMPTTPQIELTYSNWFNPTLNYNFFMVPGILAILVTMVGGFLTALNIVKEKEVGTIEQINVTPIKKIHFILGKLIPFWILGNVVFTIGLIVSYVIYGIVPVGSLWLMYAFVIAYLPAVLGFGLLVSTFCETQQQAMLIMFFFMMIFMLMGGLFTPIESMPAWAQVVSKFNPVTYLIKVMRMVVLKGSGFNDVVPYLGIILSFGVVLNTLAVLNYRKTS